MLTVKPIDAVVNTAAHDAAQDAAVNTAAQDAATKTPMAAAVTQALQDTATEAAHVAPKTTTTKLPKETTSVDIAALNAAISNTASKGKLQDLHGSNQPTIDAADTDYAAYHATISHTVSKGKSQDMHGDNLPIADDVNTTPANYAAHHTMKGKKEDQEMCNQMQSTLMQSDHNDSPDIKGNSSWIQLTHCQPCSSSMQKYTRCTHKERKLVK
jgi:hypothetical protein